MLAVDVGGTFTDVVAAFCGKIETAKVSTDYRAGQSVGHRPPEADR